MQSHHVRNVGPSRYTETVILKPTFRHLETGARCRADLGHHESWLCCTTTCRRLDGLPSAWDGFVLSAANLPKSFAAHPSGTNYVRTASFLYNSANNSRYLEIVDILIAHRDHELPSEQDFSPLSPRNTSQIALAKNLDRRLAAKHTCSSNGGLTWGLTWGLKTHLEKRRP